MIQAYGLTALRRNVPHWLLGQRALVQFAGIVVLTIASLGLSAIVTERMREARLAVGQSREMQLAIDRMVWDLLALQQPMQARRLNRDSDRASRFVGIRNNVRDDIVALIRQTADKPLQQQLLTEFDPLFRRYLSNLDRLAASEAGSGAARDLGPPLLADAEQMSLLIGEMRELEDIRLKSRFERADLSFQLLLPTLLIAASFITLLVVMAAKSINRVVRERDRWLLEKEGELATKDMMMREVNHRPRNSLDLVYKLMTLQQRPEAANQDRVASATAPSVKTSAAIWSGPSGSRSARAEVTTPMTGTAMVPIAATDAGSRASAANQLR
jgi:two-component sensor histidine kinase